MKTYNLVEKENKEFLKEDAAPPIGIKGEEEAPPISIKGEIDIKPRSAIAAKRTRKKSLKWKSCQDNNLRFGCKGFNVRQLQAKIIVSGVDFKKGADGFFGKYTEAALKEYQKKLNVAQTGVYDDTTIKAESSAVIKKPEVISPTVAEPPAATAAVAEPAPAATAETAAKEPIKAAAKVSDKLQKAIKEQGPDTGPPEGESSDGYSIDNPFPGVYSLKQKFPSSASTRATGYRYKPRANKIVYYVDIPDEFSFERPKNPPIKRIKSDNNGKVDLTKGMVVGNSSELTESKNKIIDKLKIVEKRNEQIENLVFERLVKNAN